MMGYHSTHPQFFAIFYEPAKTLQKNHGAGFPFMLVTKNIVWQLAKNLSSLCLLSITGSVGTKKS